MAPAGVAHHHGMPQHAPMPMQQHPQQHHHQHQLAPHPHQQPLMPHHPHHPQHTNAHPMSMAPGPHHHGAPAPMPQQHHLPPHQAHQQHQAAAAAAAAQQAQNNAMEAAKRRSRKPTDKTMPDGVESVIVGDGVQRYRDLRDFERRLDATMTRKRLDIVDSVQRHGPKRYKTLRIWISNTVENQLWQTGGAGVSVDSFDFSTNAEASYHVKIEGRLLDDDDDNEEGENKEDGDGAKPKEEASGDAMEMDGAAAKPKEPRYRFTQFFRAMSAEYITKKSRTAAQNNGEPDSTTPRPVEWKRPEQRPPNAPPAPVPEFDELTFKRPGDDNVNIIINLYRYEEPERFELDEILADIVDMTEATRAEAVMGLFEYIRLQNLQEDEEKRNFRCDDLLRKLVNNDIGYIPMLHEYVNAHIRPLPPIQLPYTIRVDEEFHRNSPEPTIYDVRVTVDDPLRAQLRPFVQSPQYIGLLRDVGVLDEQLAVLVQAVSMSKSKHEFLSGLSRDPARFVRQWLSSQKRDLEVIMGESVRGGTGSDLSGEAWRRGGKSSVWASQNARESVNLHLAKQPLIPRAA
ncbi:SWI/SNF and RSC complex subunit Ssr3 [Sporothrix eucalyptigena]|uniref:SWI/SNF and RSC complex subunit Ssr3 n=1 Tax=Sporothrix eucalyptigena TaxID=1812306 RepID=A0ABP0AWN2_9PEZI